MKRSLVLSHQHLGVRIHGATNYGLQNARGDKLWFHIQVVSRSFCKSSKVDGSP